MIKKELRRTVSLTEDFTNKTVGVIDNITITLSKTMNEYYIKATCNDTGISERGSFTEQQMKSLNEWNMDALEHMMFVLVNTIKSKQR